MNSNLNMTVTNYKPKILWSMVFMFSFITSGFFWGLYYLFVREVKVPTLILTFIFFIIGGIGNGPGAHRLFSHRSYKVVRGLKIFLIFCHQISGMKSLITWVRIHRTHHKFTDTVQDPTNLHRGVFYSNLGWGLYKFAPECEYEMNRIYMDDIYADKDICFHDKYYAPLHILITLGLPTIIPFYFWNESINVAFAMNMFRYGLNMIQLLIANGLLHNNGRKPYDKNTSAVDNAFYNILLLGEGFHNFHHVFPFDYRSNELFEFAHIASLSTFFIDACAYFGWVYDRKTASPHMIASRIKRTGDGSHYLSKQETSVKTISELGYPVVEMEEK